MSLKSSFWFRSFSSSLASSYLQCSYETKGWAIIRSFFTEASMSYRSPYLAGNTSSIRSNSSGCIVTSTLSAFWPRRRSTCWMMYCKIKSEIIRHNVWGITGKLFMKLWHKSYPFGTCFVLCPHDITVPKKRIRSKIWKYIHAIQRSPVYHECNNYSKRTHTEAGIGIVVINE